jgi:hypothetical protein
VSWLLSARSRILGCNELDGNDKVQGYSYFMVGTGENQLSSGSGLSKVGEVYASM